MGAHSKRHDKTRKPRTRNPDAILRSVQNEDGIGKEKRKRKVEKKVKVVFTKLQGKVINSIFSQYDNDDILEAVIDKSKIKTEERIKAEFALRNLSEVNKSQRQELEKSDIEFLVRNIKRQYKGKNPEELFNLIYGSDKLIGKDNNFTKDAHLKSDQILLYVVFKRKIDSFINENLYQKELPENNLEESSEFKKYAKIKHDLHKLHNRLEKGKVISKTFLERMEIKEPKIVRPKRSKIITQEVIKESNSRKDSSDILAEKILRKKSSKFGFRKEFVGDAMIGLKDLLQTAVENRVEIPESVDDFIFAIQNRLQKTTPSTGPYVGRESRSANNSKSTIHSISHIDKAKSISGKKPKYLFNQNPQNIIGYVLGNLLYKSDTHTSSAYDRVGLSPQIDKYDPDLSWKMKNISQNQEILLNHLRKLTAFNQEDVKIARGFIKEYDRLTDPKNNRFGWKEISNLQPIYNQCKRSLKKMSKADKLKAEVLSTVKSYLDGTVATR